MLECSTIGAFESFVWLFLKLSWTPNTAFGAKKGDFFCTADVSFVQEPSPHVWHTRPKKASLKSNLSFHGKPKRSRNGAPHSKLGWKTHRSDHLWSYRPKGHAFVRHTEVNPLDHGSLKHLEGDASGFLRRNLPQKPTNIGSWDVIHVDVKKALGFKQDF